MDGVDIFNVVDKLRKNVVSGNSNDNSSSANFLRNKQNIDIEVKSLN